MFSVPFNYFLLIKDFFISIKDNYFKTKRTWKISLKKLNEMGFSIRKLMRLLIPPVNLR